MLISVSYYEVLKYDVRSYARIIPKSINSFFSLFLNEEINRLLSRRMCVHIS